MASCYTYCRSSILSASSQRAKAAVKCVISRCSDSMSRSSGLLACTMRSAIAATHWAALVASRCSWRHRTFCSSRRQNFHQWGMKATVLNRRNPTDLHPSTLTHRGPPAPCDEALVARRAGVYQTRSSELPTSGKEILTWFAFVVCLYRVIEERRIGV